MSNAPLLRLDHLKKTFGDVVALQDFSFAIEAGEIVGIIGPNGAGKSTLFNLLTGFMRPDAGSIRLDGVNIAGAPPHIIARRGMARTFQNVRLAEHLTATENVLLFFPLQPGDRVRDIFLRPRTVWDRQKSNRTQAHSILDQFGLGEKTESIVNTLSYGQQKLLSVACCIASQARVILLDEPVAGVSLSLKTVLIDKILGLAGGGRSVVVIDHDLDVVSAIASRVIFLDRGIKIAEGSMEELRSNPLVTNSYLGERDVA